METTSTHFINEIGQVINGGFTAFDDLDRTLIEFLSTGINSYEELARQCKVSRNTVYKRIAALENKGIIKNVVRCTVNFESLDIIPVNIAANVPTDREDEAVKLLLTHPKIRFLWRTFGDHNLVLLAFCTKGEEGLLIESLKEILENVDSSHVHVSTGYVWEKSETSPFDEKLKFKALDAEKREKSIKTLQL